MEKLDDILIRNSIKNVLSSSIVKILGLDYLYIKFHNQDELYVTSYGIPLLEQLQPEKFWLDKVWFNVNATRLAGTSCIYRIPTRPEKSIRKDIVLKWNRMGEDVPGFNDFDEFSNAAFNSPFEEFSLVTELKNTKYEYTGRIITQKPLAIYVPAEFFELWQTGRKEYRMKNLINRHQEITIDQHRLYAVIYEWLKGIDAAEASQAGYITNHEMQELTKQAEITLKKKGFLVRDRKPHHLIVRPIDTEHLLCDKKGEIIYGMIDFELLERTPEREEIIARTKRHTYLIKQKNRFNVELKKELLPANRYLINIFGVDYIYGHCESTHGALWVVGKDPDLFDYFLPERWERTPRIKLSTGHEIYYTLTRDNINLVWKVSHVGCRPDVNPFKPDEKLILDYGYNSPFEEVSLAIELNNKGIPTIYPRAIYMTGNKVDIAEFLKVHSRYHSHGSLRTPDGDPVLRQDRDYIILYGYWNGPDEKLALEDNDYYQGINVLQAYWDKIITHEQYLELIQSAKQKLSSIGIEDLNLKGSHLMLSFDAAGNLVMDASRQPEVRICNFEFLRRIG